MWMQFVVIGDCGRVDVSNRRYSMLNQFMSSP